MIANVYEHPAKYGGYIGNWHDNRFACETAAITELRYEPLAKIVGRVKVKGIRVAAVLR